MMRSLFVGVTGLRQHQTKMDVISNNIANVNTTGFKKGRVLFSDLFSQTLRYAQQAFGGVGGLNPMQVGNGVQLASIDTIMTQGTPETTGKDTDLAIEGNGFFVVNTGTGKNVYTRDGNLAINPNYDLVNSGTGYKVQGWLSQQNPATGNLELKDDGVAPYTINLIKYLKKHAHQTNNITYASNLDSSSDERDIVLGQDTLTFKDSTGNFQNLKFKFKKLDSKNWVWSAMSDTQGEVATGGITTDENGKMLVSTVTPAGTQSTVGVPYFTYDPDGTPAPASATTLLGTVTNTGNGAAGTVTASGSDIRDENITITYDGGDPTRALSYRVVGDQRGFIGSGFLGGTQARIDGNPVNFDVQWMPSQALSFQVTDAQTMATVPPSTKETRATVTFNALTNFTTSQIVDKINQAMNNSGVRATAYYDSVTKKYSIVSNDTGSNRTLMIDNVTGPMADLGFDMSTIGRTQVQSTMDFSFFGTAFTGTRDYTAEPIAVANPVNFQIRDQHSHQANVSVPAGNYTRAQLQSLIQTELTNNNIPATVTFVDSNVDLIPDQLRINANTGEKIQITDGLGLTTELGIVPSNQWTPPRDIAFRITRPNSQVANISITQAGGPYSAQQLQQTVQNQIDASFGAGVLAASLSDSNNDGVADKLVFDSANPTEKMIYDNTQNISLLGISSGLNVMGTGGAKPEVFSNGVDFTNDAWDPVGQVQFTVRDRDGHTALVTFPDQVNGANQIYTRTSIVSTINTALASNNVAASANMIDTNNDGTPDQLVITGTRTGAGEKVILSSVTRLEQLGLPNIEQTGTAAVSHFNTGGLDFTLTEGTNPWLPNETMRMQTYAARGQANSVNVYVPQPTADQVKFAVQQGTETYQITGAVQTGAIHKTNITIYDSLGGPHVLETVWEHTNKASHEWNYKIQYEKSDPEILSWLKDPANGVTDPANPTDAELDRANEALITNRRGTIFFFDNGKIDLGKSLVKDVSMIPIGSNKLTVHLDKALITQFDSPFTTAAREQDGYEMGLLQSVFFERDGTIKGVYSNGQKQPIGQVALASFSNPAGLEKNGKNMYDVSANSGLALIGKALTSDRGSINAGALEMSNVDVAEEFTQMIVTQRAFQANSRVITTSDEMLVEVVNLKR